MVRNISGKEFKEMIENDPNSLEIIDVREPDEYDLVKIKNSKLMSFAELMRDPSQIDWSKKVVFVCRSGSRSGYVAQLFSEHKDVLNLQHGIWELNLDQCDCLEKSPDCCEGYF